ncbi:MAG: hypothetical protein JNJ85_03215 [Candidatus Kapabacteria bacterium]|nr:hypothetical protein [Candidatus Kapabacteria bacterium]
MIQTPINYKDIIHFNGYTLEYFNSTEICQGGPVVGNIIINNIHHDEYFGGPAIFNDGYLYIPMLVNRFLLGRGFKLIRINLNTQIPETLIKFKYLIYLDHITNNRVYYYEDINKTKLTYYDFTKNQI